MAIFPTGMQPCVVLESRDYCGKSTVSSELASLIGATLVKTPTDSVAQFREVYDTCENYTARYLYYLSTLAIASREISELLKVGPVVVDRYIHSTVIYHRILGVDTTVVDIGKLGLVVPTLTVCLTANEEVLAERKCRRAEVRKDNIEDIAGLLMQVGQAMLAEIPVHVDTSYTTPFEAAQQIAAML